MSTPISDDAAERKPRAGAARAIWALYAIIVFEILFMISPFALYYYSAYAIPLNWLAGTPATAWLVQHILPHFAWHTSALARVLMTIAWPLIFAGLILFLIAFAQIYWAKFTGKGAVVFGLYRYIRHPQYLALAIIGLGATLYWSRFLILIAYVTMLFLYYWLARYEESRCRAQFGASYEAYLERTGRFFPRASRAAVLHRLGLTWRLPGGAVGQIVLYLILTAALVGGGFALKRHVIGELQTTARSNFILVALAPVDSLAPWWSLASRSPEISRHLADSLGENEPTIAYLVPGSWSIPELGLTPDSRHAPSNRDELLRPSQHGNSLEFDRRHWRVLFTRAEGNADPDDLLMTAIGVTPLFVVDVFDGRINGVSTEPGKSGWSGIPVPIY